MNTAAPAPLPAPRGLGRLRARPPARHRAVVRQEIFLDPIGTDAVFAAPRALRIDTSRRRGGLDDMGSIVLHHGVDAASVLVDSELEQRRPRGLRPAPWPVGACPACPALPPASALPRRIGALAREVTAGSRGPTRPRPAASASTSRQHHLPLHPRAQQQTTPRPLEEFLFVRRSGNCEYFAAAMAVMLRSVGIPAPGGGRLPAAASGTRTGATSWCA